jgi:succinate-acetate transporter protein
VLAGILEWEKNNLFGNIAFMSYGFFWISLVITFTWPVTPEVKATSETALATYMLIWGVFSFGMWIATLKKSPYAL